VSDEQVREIAERMVSAALSAQGARKSAGGRVYTRGDLMSWCLPLAEAMEANVGARMDRMTASMAELGTQVRAFAAGEQARKDEAAKAFGMTVRGAQEPHRMPPFDPEQMRLHAHLGPPAPGPQINGHGAFAPEGGH
jgi:hypothetical protein